MSKGDKSVMRRTWHITECVITRGPEVFGCAGECARDRESRIPFGTDPILGALYLTSSEVDQLTAVLSGHERATLPGEVTGLLRTIRAQVMEERRAGVPNPNSPDPVGPVGNDGHRCPLPPDPPMGARLPCPCGARWKARRGQWIREDGQCDG